MLHQISWGQFLVTAGLAAGLWCLAVAGRYYRDELKAWLERRPAAQEKAWQEEVGAEEEESLMGRIREPEGLETLSAHELAFGTVPDVLEELKYIFYQLAQTGGGKAEFLQLFAGVTGKYPGLPGTPNFFAICDHIRENVDFEISDEEVEDLFV